MRTRTVALAAVLALLAACTGGGDGSRDPTSSPSTEPWRGGTLRVALAGDAFEQLDPQREYFAATWELLRCCLLRTLFSYNGLPASEGGVRTITPRPIQTTAPATRSHHAFTANRTS